MFSAVSLTLSLAFISHRSFPGAARAKLLLVAALLLAGCGGAANRSWQQVEGDGFVYNAPANWTVDGSTAVDGQVDRVEVLVFRLLRPYDSTKRVGAARELDRVAAGIAAQLKGSVMSRRSLEVGGLDGRTYTVVFNGKTEQITFALRGRREYQLLCRHRLGADEAPCAELVKSFRVR